jgi:hypothetical protein
MPTDVSTVALIPPGNAPLIASTSLVCALISVTVAEATLVSSTSVIDTWLLVIGAAGPLTV